MSKKRCSPFRFSALLVLSWVSGAFASAAPCCGGNAALPTIVTGDDRAQVQVALAHETVVGDALAQGLQRLRSENDRERTDTLRIDAGYRVSDRVQIGLSLPVVHRTRTIDAAQAASAGLGDVSSTLAYEILPEWTYSAWRPKGFAFAQVAFPTSPSVYDSIAPYQIDARGRGFYSAALGAAFLKGIADWDFLLSFKAQRSFARAVSYLGASDLKVVPGFGASFLLGAGWSPGGGKLRLGAMLSPVWESAIRSEGAIDSVSSSQWVWNASAQLSYLASEEWSGSLIYTDQTWISGARNVSLSRMVVAALQKRWSL